MARGARRRGFAMWQAAPAANQPVSPFLARAVCPSSTREDTAKVRVR